MAQTRKKTDKKGNPPDDFSEIILSFIHDINVNPYILGIAYIILNLGGRFMVMSVTPAQEAFLQNIIFRPLLLFAIMFIGTRNMIVAFWLTVVVLTCLHYLFNEKSTWYVFHDWQSSEPTHSNQVSRQ
jgi:hypothetical protein